MKIEPLGDHLEVIPTLAGWHLAEWGRHGPSRTQESIEARLQRHQSRDAIPMSLVALEAGVPVGSAALVVSDRLYARLGWEEMERVVYRQEEVVVMRIRP